MFFERTYLFQGLSEEVLHEIAGALVEENYDEGTELFKEGEAAENLFVLVEGRVRLKLGGKGTITKVVSSPGDAFGWSSLLHNDLYTATAISLTPLKVQKVPGKVMNEIFEKYPTSGLLFYRRLARLIRQRLIDSYKMLLTYDPEKRPLSFG
jgi:CRP-like cAMP-binding protein